MSDSERPKKVARVDSDQEDKNEILLGQNAIDFLRVQLAQKNPIQAIATFQEEQGLDAKTNVRPALPLLDLLGVQRPELYHTLLMKLKTRLLNKLNSSKEFLDKLLSDSIAYIGLPELRPIVLEVLRRHPNIPKDYLALIAGEPGLLEMCGIEVKRQVWQHRPQQYMAMVKPLLTKYVERMEQSLRGHDWDSLSSLDIKARRKSPEIAELVANIGSEIKLYNFVLTKIRTEFVNTGIASYCSLRADLLQALHDSGLSVFSKFDPCFKFVRSLAGCAIERNVDGPRARELCVAMDKAGKGAVLGDLGMVITDPPVYQMLLKTCFNAISNCISARVLPAESEILKSVCRLLYTSKVARYRMKKQRFDDEMDLTSLQQTVFPQLAGFIVKEELRKADPKFVDGDLHMPALIQGIQDNSFVGNIMLQYASSLLMTQKASLFVMTSPLRLSPSRSKTTEATSKIKGPNLSTVARLLPLLADSVSGSWHFQTNDGSGECRFQFARSLAKCCSQSIRESNEDCQTILNLLFIPQSFESLEMHSLAIEILLSMCRANPKDKTFVQGALSKLCQNAKYPYADDVSQQVAQAFLPRMRENYEGLVQSELGDDLTASMQEKTKRMSECLSK
eukprot:m.13649 g.13649  ORF g.13649 m.13649 type:complete len:620 (-) comp4892_c0_seq1:41-1900(-)